MSIEIIHDDDTLSSGFINIGGKSFPGLGKLPKRGGIIGIAFNSRKHLDAAIAFLQIARTKMYDDDASAKTSRNAPSKSKSKSTSATTAPATTRKTRKKGTR